MKNTRVFFYCVVVLIYFTSGTPTGLWLDDYERDFSDAEKLYQNFRTGFLQLKNINASESEKLVRAICDAEEDERKAASSNALSRMRSAVTSDFNQLQSSMGYADRALKKAMESLKKAKSDNTEYKKNGRKIDELMNKAEDYNKDMDTKWESIKKMTAGIRGGNHPVVAWMLDAGQAAHSDRQHSSQFQATEFTAGAAGRIDCLIADGKKLIVVELKPCNSKALNKGIEQLGRYITELQNHWKTYKPQLVSKNSKFAAVTEISGRIDCYTLCPAITDDGGYEKAYVKWSQAIKVKDVSPNSLK
jgi:SMC interacting uncharacterized protein involved in chromosome segregation